MHHITELLKFKSFVLITSLLFLNNVMVMANENDCYIVPPYVLHVDHESAKVVWVSPGETPAGEVHLEASDGGQKQQITAEQSRPPFVQIDSDDSSVFHELDHLRQIVHIQGLESFSDYEYQVKCGDGVTSISGSFKTAPAPGETPAFEFVATADAHANRGASRPLYSAIAEAIADEDPNFMIHAGDYKGQRGAHWTSWPAYFRVARPYLEKTVHWPVVGNHDVYPAGNFRALFAFNDPDGDPAEEDDAGTWYNFTFSNAEFFVLDFVYEFDTQLEWIQQQLAESNAEWKIVALHNFSFNVGGRTSLLPDIYRDFADVFEEYGVDVVIAGHRHINERKLPVGSEDTKPVNYIHINSAGTGAFIERPSPIVVNDYEQSMFMYNHFRIDGNHLEMEAKTADGIVHDHLVLIKDEDGMYQDEVMDQAVDVDLALEIAHIYSGDYSDRFAREDMAAEFTAIPEADKTFEVILDVGRFPTGSELVVYEQQQPEWWRVDGQTIEVTDETVSLEVTAPENLERTDGNFDPPFKLNLNLRMDGREFTSSTVIPNVHLN